MSENILVPLAAMALALLSVAACSTRNPQFCDEQSDCSHLRGSSFCDIDALLPGTELLNTCVAPPEGELCNRAQTCTSAARPYCSDETPGILGECVQCTSSEHCQGDCDPTTNTCVLPCTPGSAGDSICASADAARPYCAATDTCSECKVSIHCEEAAASVCDQVDFACRGCLANSECGSLYCEGDGLCAQADSILYVSPDGSGSICTQEEPCSTIDKAIDNVSSLRRRIVIAEGDYDEQLVINDLDVEIVGIGSVRLISSLGDGESLLTVTGTSTVLISDVEFRPAAAAVGTDAIKCDGTSASLSLERVGVFRSRDLGIFAIDCQLKVNASELIGNDGGAILVMGGGGFSITNSVIAHNITSTSRPAVELSTNAGLQRFDFNTVVGNSTMGPTAGVTCATAPALRGSGNIVYGNSGGAPFLGCLWEYSDIEGIAIGDNNIDADPLLVNNVAFGDYHLQAGSPCIDKADASSTITRDIDGEARPQGLAPDMGADELTAGP